ncbi:MAG: hypothetical protein IKE75_04885 [Bacilli bacterium]|nr:hypothetical protein [Bacilli bacterium]
MIENRIRLLIKKAENKISKKGSIKEELTVLKMAKEYLEEKDPTNKTLDMFKNNLDSLENYQKKYETQKREEKKQKRLKKLKLEKTNEYKELWSGKSFFYKLIHRNIRPINLDLANATLENINNLINKVSGPKKTK